MYNDLFGDLKEEIEREEQERREEEKKKKELAEEEEKTKKRIDFSLEAKSPIQDLK